MAWALVSVARDVVNKQVQCFSFFPNYFGVFPRNNDIGCLLHGMIPSGGVPGLRLSTGFSESVLHGLDGIFYKGGKRDVSFCMMFDSFSAGLMSDFLSLGVPYE